MVQIASPALAFEDIFKTRLKAKHFFRSATRCNPITGQSTVVGLLLQNFHDMGFDIEYVLIVQSKFTQRLR